MSSPVESSFVTRMVRAALLDPDLYEQVEVDRSATAQAVGVVAIASVAAGIGGLNGGTMGIVGAVCASLIGWLIWAGLIYFIGGRLFPEPGTRVDWPAILRTSGFAQAPGVLYVLGIIPLLGWIAVIAVSIWVLIAVVVAVRHALDYHSIPRTVGVCLAGWLIQGIARAIFF